MLEVSVVYFLCFLARFSIEAETLKDGEMITLNDNNRVVKAVTRTFFDNSKGWLR